MQQHPVRSLDCRKVCSQTPSVLLVVQQLDDLERRPQLLRERLYHGELKCEVVMDQESLTGRGDRDHSYPRQPTNLSQCTDARKCEGDKSGHNNENGSACSMQRHRVESDRDSEHT